MVHELLSSTGSFRFILSGSKKFEYVYNDGSYKIGDFLLLKEFSLVHDSYTGREIMAVITHVMTGDKGVDMQKDYCILGLDVIYKSNN